MLSDFIDAILTLLCINGNMPLLYAAYYHIGIVCGQSGRSERHNVIYWHYVNNSARLSADAVSLSPLIWILLRVARGRALAIKDLIMALLA